MSLPHDFLIELKNKKNKSQYEETYELILDCERIVKEMAKRSLRKKLEEQARAFTRLSIFQSIIINACYSNFFIFLVKLVINLKSFNILSSINLLRYYLFEIPNVSFLNPLIVSGLVYIPLVLIIQLFKRLGWFNLTTQIILFLVISVLYIFITVFLQLIIPRVIIEHDTKWTEVKKHYLSYIKYKTSKQKDYLKEARNKIKRAITYYRRGGEIWDLFIGFVWGSIFIGSLPDPDFQDAIWAAFMKFIEAKSVFDFSLYREMFLELWCKNKFATICLLLVPFISSFNTAKFKRPIAIMEKVLSEIELDE